ncbi:MAG: hypothetical protein JW797_13140 [Bradymonadales bacterium]|nr:hypothetical protein [Bradymonadales bacterium]
MAIPGYVELSRSGEIERRAESLMKRLVRCDLCPRGCGVDRRVGTGFCGIGIKARLAAAVPHRGEEPVLADRASGGIFLSGCNLACLFCQNYQISQVRPPPGIELEPDRLGDHMLRLQAMGCQNINLVSPSHVVPQVLLAIASASRRGLRLPLVWNSNAYEKVEVLRLLEGVVDLYLPDLKYSGDGMARLLSGADRYTAVSRAALLEMKRQVGPLELDERGLARRGLIVRHLVLPHNAGGTPGVLRFLAEHLGPGVAVSLMAQYAPVHRAVGHPVVGRSLTREEYGRAVEWLDRLGLEQGWVQSLEESPDYYRPDFDADHPFEGS